MIGLRVIGGSVLRIERPGVSGGEDPDEAPPSLVLLRGPPQHFDLTGARERDGERVEREREKGETGSGERERDRVGERDR